MDARGYYFQFGYDAEMVAALKYAVHPEKRSWNPETKRWRVSEFRDAETVRLAFKALGAERISENAWQEQRKRREEREERRAAPPPRGPADPYATLHLREDAPWAVVRAAYRALSTLHHPDAGGSEEHMKRINGAYADLRTRLEPTNG